MAFENYPYQSYTWDYQGFDYFAISNLTAALAQQMYDDGVRFVGRYLFAEQYPYGKGISTAEAQLYLDAGISIYLYYEVLNNDALGGYNRGVTNGQAALSQALSVGVPAHTPIICCCDTGVTDTEASGVVMQYLQGFADQLPNYTVGIYGGSNVMQAAFNFNPDYWRVQAGAWGNYEFNGINIRQWLLGANRSALNDGYIRISNITIDSSGYAYWRGHNVDLISAPALSYMWNSGSPSPPTPPTPPVPPVDEGKMPIWFYLRLF